MSNASDTPMLTITTDAEGNIVIKSSDDLQRILVAGPGTYTLALTNAEVETVETTHAKSVDKIRTFDPVTFGKDAALRIIDTLRELEGVRVRETSSVSFTKEAAQRIASAVRLIEKVAEVVRASDEADASRITT